MSNKVGLYFIKESALKEVLRLPDNVSIANVRMDNSWRTGITFKLECKDFAEVDEGSQIPDVLLTLTKHECGHECEFGRHIEIEFVELK